MNRPWVFQAIGLFLSMAFLVPDARPTDFPTDSRTRRVQQISIGATADVPKTRVFIQTAGIDEKDVIEFRKTLISSGAEKVNLFVPSMIIVCEVPATLDLRALADDPRYSIVEDSEAQARVGSGAQGSEDLRFIRTCYERALTEPRGTEQLRGETGFEDVVRVVAPEDVEESKARADLFRASGAVNERNIQQNSEFLVGDVLVQLIFPESNGAAEDWTDQELADAASGAYAACLDFQTKFGYAPMHFVVLTEQRIPTTSEPITTTMEQHPVWIQELMNHLGIPLDKSMELMVHEYNNRGRTYWRTDWAFTAFIARSVNDDDHRFADRFYTAYAALGGPYLVIPDPAGENPFMIEDWLVFSTIFQHEMAHVFWALDEYPGPNNMSECSSHTGYLNYFNRNKVDELEPGVFTGCTNAPPQLCTMWRAKEDLGRPLCPYTQGQIGVIDYNGNSIPDVFEAGPTVEFVDAAEETVDTPDVTVRVKIVSQAVPNDNPFQALVDRVAYAPSIKDAAVSINGAGSIYLGPVDGKWDEVEEEMSIALSGIPVGLTTVGVTGRNAFGKASAQVSKSIYFPGIKFALFGLNPLNDGTRNMIRVSWSTVGETFGARLDLHRIDSSSGAPDTTCLTAAIQPRPPLTGVFRNYVFDDAAVTPGRSYRYFVKGYFQIVRGDTIDYEVESDSYEAQSMFPIHSGRLLSDASPNPFREKTQISVKIPDTSGISVNGASAASSGTLASKTPVTVVVYDVAGRLVRKVYDGELYTGVRTFEWKGNNEDNERVPSGVYFVKTVAGSSTDVRKVVVVR